MEIHQFQLFNGKFIQVTHEIKKLSRDCKRYINQVTFCYHKHSGLESWFDFNLLHIKKNEMNHCVNAVLSTDFSLWGTVGLPWCWRGWILWALAPSSWTSRLSPPGSSSSVRRHGPSRATACPARRPSPRPSPADPTSTASSSSCESHEHFFIFLQLCVGKRPLIS